MEERGFGLTVHSKVLVLCIYFLNIFSFSRYAGTNIHTSKENSVTAFHIHYTITHACLSKWSFYKLVLPTSLKYPSVYG